MSTIEFGENNRPSPIPVTQPAHTSNTPIAGFIIRSGLAKDDAGVNRVMIITSIICIVLIGIIVFTNLDSRAPVSEVQHEFIFRPEVPR